MLCHIERVCYGRSKGCVNDVHRESVLCVPYQEGVSPAATSALDSVWTTSEDCMVVSMDANVRGPEAEVVMVKAMITPRALLLLLLLDNDDDNDAVNDDVDDDALLLDNDDDDNGGDVDDVGCGGIPLINSNSSPPINFLPRILLALAATLLMTN